MPKANRRRDYFIKKWLQTRFILYYLLLMIGSAGVLGVLIHRYAYEALRREMFQGHSTSFNTWESLRPGIIKANLIVNGLVILTAIAVTLFICWVVRRACRTMTGNFQATVEGASPDGWGKVPYMKEMKNLQDSFAESLADHRAQVDALRQESTELARKVAAAKEAFREGEVDPAVLREIHVSCEGIKHRYGLFKLK